MEEPIPIVSVVTIEPPRPGRKRLAGTTMALVIGLAALTATASESDLVRDIQRYCTVCWRNARLDPGLWDDCTQEVCCRLLGKARAGQLDLNLVLADDTAERRELVRAIDMVRKRVQRARSATSRSTTSSPPAPTSTGGTASARSSARSSKPPARPCSRRARTGSSSSGPDGWTVPEIGEDAGPAAWPGSATRSTRPSASSSTTSPTAPTRAADVG